MYLQNKNIEATKKKLQKKTTNTAPIVKKKSFIFK